MLYHVGLKLRDADVPELVLKEDHTGHVTLLNEPFISS